MDEDQPVKLYWLYKFGEAIRSDMFCIIDDINGLSQHISSLKNLAGKLIIIRLDGQLYNEVNL